MIVANRAYSDPNIARAAQSLARLFAPPSAGDTANYAKANALREDAARRAHLFNAAQNGEVAWDVLDRLSFGAGLQNGNQTLQSVDRNNARALQERQLMEGGLDRRNAADNERAMMQAIMKQATDPVSQGAVRPGFDPADYGVGAPVVPEFAGREKPLSETELKATILRRLPQELQEAAAFGSTPVETIMGDNGPVFATRPDAIGQTPAPSGPEAGYKAPDNYLITGENGETVPALAHTDRNTGRIVTPSGEDITDRVIRRVGASDGGMSLEVDGQGGVRLQTGGGQSGTVANQTALQAQEREMNRIANEMSTLYGTISAADVGVAGNANEFLTRYGAQLFPGVARGDVSAMRANIRGSTIQIARALSGDSRISDIDRRIAQDVMVSDGFDESLPSAKAKLASLVTLFAYRSLFASEQLQGQTLPPINGEILGQLVDAGRISPAAAQEFYRTVLSRRQGRPVRTLGTGETDRMAGEAAAAAVVPQGAQDGLPQVANDADYEALRSGAEFIDPEGNRRRKP